MLTSAEKVAVRRFCGFASYSTYGSVYEADYQKLELRMNTFSVDEETVIRTIYLVNLPAMELALFGTSANLDTAAASVWTHNKNELADRQRLLDKVRRDLCAFIGVKPGHGLDSAGLVRG